MADHDIFVVNGFQVFGAIQNGLKFVKRYLDIRVSRIVGDDDMEVVCVLELTDLIIQWPLGKQSGPVWSRGFESCTGNNRVRLTPKRVVVQIFFWINIIVRLFGTNVFDLNQLTYMLHFSFGEAGELKYSVDKCECPWVLWKGLCRDHHQCQL